MEEVAKMLATSFSNLGHNVLLVTHTTTNGKIDEPDFGFLVYRNPGFVTYLKLLINADIILHNCISLNQVFPDFFFKKKLFVIHHTWYKGGQNLKSRFVAFFKKKASSFIHNIYISEVIRKDLNLKGTVIPNPYRDDLFKELIPYEKREIEMVFVGRLVSDKGCDTLLEAMKILKDRAVFLRLTVIGGGEQMSFLKGYAQENLNEQVKFKGALYGNELVEEINLHKLVIVPSKWEEPFGIVTLEGIACGCLAIVSKRGGLVDAMGGCGWTFENGDALDLANTLEYIVRNQDQWYVKKKNVDNHLDRHKEIKIAHEYLKYFYEMV